LTLDNYRWLSFCVLRIHYKHILTSSICSYFGKLAIWKTVRELEG
jgi:hypothetical protein